VPAPGPAPALDVALAASPPAPPAPTAPPPFRPVIIAPTYNHAATLQTFLPALLHRAAALCVPVIIINDGSSDDTPRVLHAIPNLTILTHPANRGKAAALRTGFEHALAQRFTHALTIDTDGQHTPDDIQTLLALAHQHQHALILGTRARTIPGYPLGSRAGRAVSNFWVWAESGQRVTDSQSGLRVYPLVIERQLRCRAARYGYETEVLTRLGWAGGQIIQHNIACTYTIPGGRLTHFKPTKDSLAAVAMHLYLWHRALLPGKPAGPRLPHSSPHLGTLWHRALWFFSPKRLWTMIRGDHAGRERFAASVAWGVMMAFAPLYGIKTIACLALAAKLRLHPLVLIGTSSLCTPPLGFLFIAASVTTGHLLLRGGMPDLSALDPRTAGAFHAMGGFLLDWIVGSLVAGAAFALLVYWALKLALLGRACNSRALSNPVPLTPASPAKASPAQG